MEKWWKVKKGVSRKTAFFKNKILTYSGAEGWPVSQYKIIIAQQGTQPKRKFGCWGTSKSITSDWSKTSGVRSDAASSLNVCFCTVDQLCQDMNNEIDGLWSWVYWRKMSGVMTKTGSEMFGIKKLHDRSSRARLEVSQQKEHQGSVPTLSKHVAD